MRVEGRGLKHFGEGQFHLIRESCEMSRGNLVVLVLNKMKVLDQQIAPPRPVPQQKLDLMRAVGSICLPFWVALARRRPSPG